MRTRWAYGFGAIVLAACGGSGPRVEGAKASPPSCARARAHALPQRLPTANGAAERQGSAVALAKRGDRTVAYVADADRNVVITFDLDTLVPLAATAVAGSPAQVVVLPDGRVAATLRDANRVVVLEPAAAEGDAMEERCSVSVPTEPFALAVTPDDATLLVTSAYAAKLSGLGTERLEQKFQKDVPREPRAVITDDAGTRAFVAHVVGAKMSVVDLDTADHDARSVDLRTEAHVPTVRFNRQTASMDARREGCQGFALAKSVQLPKARVGDAQPPEEPKKVDPPKPKVAPPPKKEQVELPDKTRIYAPMVTVEPGDSNARPSGYGAPASDPLGLEAPMVGVVDSAAERPLTKRIQPRTGNRVDECLLPRAAAVSPQDGRLYVTCLGVDALLELEPHGTDPMRFERRRWTVPAGPVGLALDPERARAAVWSQFDRALAVVDLTKDTEVRATGMRAFDAGFVAFAAKPPPSAHFELGRELFHRTDDLRISKDGRACASCHPDGREDALTWPTPVGPRQTLMLAGRLEGSAPFSWSGSHASVEEHLAATFQRLGGAGLHGVELAAVVDYVHHMPAPRIAADPAKAELVARGRFLFGAGEKSCASCHVAGGTDHERHAMASDRLDTPTLRFVAGTAPYFHDGRYETLVELLIESDRDMAHTGHLSRRDLHALTAYLETL